MVYLPFAISHPLFGHDPFAVAARAGKRAVGPDVGWPVTGAPGSAAAGTGDGINRDVGCPHAAAGGARHAGAGVHTSTTTEGTARCGLQERPMSPSPTHLTGGPGRHETKRVPPLATTEGAHCVYCGGAKEWGFCALHVAAPSLVSRRSRRSRSWRFSTSSWLARVVR